MLKFCRRYLQTQQQHPRTIRLGDSEVITRRFTQSDINTFSELVGDRNPIHLNPEAAKKAGFPNTICHGMLVASLFSNVMGMQLPGPQSVYLSQHVSFRAPVLAEEEVIATVKVEQFYRKKGLILLRTSVEKEGADGKRILCIDGHAMGMNRVVSFDGESEWSPAKFLPK